MMPAKKSKPFTDGLTHDEKAPNKAITPRTGAQVWEEFFEFMRGVEIPEDWMKDRPMNRISTEDRTLFREDD